MTDHYAASEASLHDLMTGDGSTSHYRSTAAVTHALHDIADAIRQLAPKPVEIKTGMTFPPGFASALAVDAMASRGKRSQVATGGDLAASHPEPGQEGTPDDPDATQGNVARNDIMCADCSAPLPSLLRWERELLDLHEYRCIGCQRATAWQARAEKAEAELSQSRDTQRKLVGERDQATEWLRAADAAALRRLIASHADHTPEG